MIEMNDERVKGDPRWQRDMIIMMMIIDENFLSARSWVLFDCAFQSIIILM